MARKKNRRIESTLNKVIKTIVKTVAIDEAILFGSHAKGTANENSDIDLAVTSSELTHKSILSNNRSLKMRTKLIEPGLQLFAFNSNAFRNETFVDPSFIQEIKRTGKKIYTKEQGLNLSCL